MASGNGQYDGDGTLHQADALHDPAPPTAGETVVDDPDVPADPDEPTRAQTFAARAALASARGPRRRYRGPWSIPMLLLVIGLMAAMGVYGLVWFTRLQEKNDRADLRNLQERAVMAGWRAEYKRLRARQLPPELADSEPPGRGYDPLTPAERARYEGLLARFGQQFKPDEGQQAFIREAESLQARFAPNTGPAQ